MSDQSIPEETSDFRRRAAVAQDWAKDQVQELKGRGPFFMAKLYVVAAYVVIVVLSLILVPPSQPEWTVAQSRLSFGLSFKTAIKVKNLGAGDLDEAAVEVSGAGIEFDGKETPGVWKTKMLALPEGLETQIVSEQLFDAKGANPPYSLVATEVRIFDGPIEIARLPVPPAAEKK